MRVYSSRVVRRLLCLGLNIWFYKVLFFLFCFVVVRIAIFLFLYLVCIEVVSSLCSSIRVVVSFREVAWRSVWEL